MVATAILTRATVGGKPLCKQAWHAIVLLRPVRGQRWPFTRWGFAGHVLVGSLTHPALGNYAGHYVRPGRRGPLLVVYVRRYSVSPCRIGVYAERMRSLTRRASGPIALLRPSGFRSELRVPSQPGGCQLIETGNINLIHHKYVMAYSVGAYNRPNYKVGLAYSDHLLGPYKKALRRRARRAWGESTEVDYLLQSQTPRWCHYIGGQVNAPGVPSLQHDGSHWYVYFAGYRAHQPLSGGLYPANTRRPYYAPVEVHIPPGASVSNTSPYRLRTWIEVREKGGGATACF